MPVFLVRLPHGRIVAASGAAHSLLMQGQAGASADELTGRTISEFLEDKESTVRALALVESGDIEGYRREPLLIRSDGSRVPADVRVSVCDKELPHALAVAVVLPAGRGSPDVAVATGVDSSDPPSVIGLVDAEWRVTHLSSTADELFGRTTDDVIGESVLSFIHDSDVPELLVTLGHSADSSRPASLRVRVRRDDAQWVFARMLVSRLSNCPLPAFAFVIAALPGEAVSDRVRLPEMEMRLRRIAREVQAVGADKSLVQVSARRTSDNLADLTPREWEVVSLLLAGERVPSIAQSLFLSQSTVRNHLSSVFRKTGMHSQHELLGRLRRSPS